MTNHISASFVERHQIYVALRTHNANKSNDVIKQLAGSCATKFIFDNLRHATLKRELKAVKGTVDVLVRKVGALEGQVGVLEGQVADALTVFRTIQNERNVGQKQSSRNTRGSPSGDGGQPPSGMCSWFLLIVC